MAKWTKGPWEWQGKHWRVDSDLSEVPRPYVMVDDERPRRWIAFCFGVPGHDSIIGIELRRRDLGDDA